MVWLITLGLLLGSVLFVLGLRGRWVGDHPYCRKCEFDLFGRDESTFVCSECGSDLNQHKAIVTGLHRRRYWMLLPGLLMVIASLGWSGWRLKGIDPTPYKPDWWMAREARSPDAPTRVAAILELTRRLNNNALSDSRIQSLVNHALNMQADQNQTWLPEWGDFVQEAFAARKVTDAQWEQYIRQGTESKVIIRNRVSQGDAPIPLKRRTGWGVSQYIGPILIFRSG